MKWISFKKQRPPTLSDEPKRFRELFGSDESLLSIANTLIGAEVAA